MSKIRIILAILAVLLMSFFSFLFFDIARALDPNLYHSISIEVPQDRILTAVLSYDPNEPLTSYEIKKINNLFALYEFNDFIVSSTGNKTKNNFFDFSAYQYLERDSELFIDFAFSTNEINNEEANSIIKNTAEFIKENIKLNGINTSEIQINERFPKKQYSFANLVFRLIYFLILGSIVFVVFFIIFRKKISNSLMLRIVLFLFLANSMIMIGYDLIKTIGGSNKFYKTVTIDEYIKISQKIEFSEPDIKSSSNKYIWNLYPSTSDFIENIYQYSESHKGKYAWWENPVFSYDLKTNEFVMLYSKKNLYISDEFIIEYTKSTIHKRDYYQYFTNDNITHLNQIFSLAVNHLIEYAENSGISLKQVNEINFENNYYNYPFLVPMERLVLFILSCIGSIYIVLLLLKKR